MAFCDALLPREQRYISPMYRRMSRGWGVTQRTREEIVHALAFVLYPGLDYVHVRTMMRWHYGMKYVFANLREIPTLVEDARRLANTWLPDGEAMLRCLLDEKPDWAGTVPLWCTMWLKEQRKRGHTAVEIAQDLGVGVDKVRRWWNLDIFDPLTGVRMAAQLGKRRSTHTTRSNSFQ